jgi:hypothetical protein
MRILAKLKYVALVAMACSCLAQISTSAAAQLAGSGNHGIDPAQCGAANPPEWCAGPDMGAWINAAIAALPGGCGVIDIAASKAYAVSTAIRKPRCVKIKGPSSTGATLKWQNSSGAMILASDGLGDGQWAEGGVEDLTVSCNGNDKPTIGIYVGGDPANALQPSTNFGDFQNFNRVRVKQCGTGIQFGNNAWSVTIEESLLAYNGTGLYFPGGLTNSGERITIDNSAVQNSTGIGVKIGDGTALTPADITLSNSSLDYNRSWQVQNGRSSGQFLTLDHVKVYAPDHWLQSFGAVVVANSAFYDGSNWASLGYLIDNESTSVSTFYGNEVFPPARAVVLNPAAPAGGVWLGNIESVPAPNNKRLGNIDRFGNAYFQTLSVVGPTVYETFKNSDFPGTTPNGLVTFASGGATVSIAPAGTTSGIQGIAVSGAGRSGRVNVAEYGRLLCNFDDSAAALHYVQMSASADGDCTDAGAKLPINGKQLLGRVVAGGMGAGTYAISFWGPGVVAYPQTALTACGSTSTCVGTQSAGYVVNGKVTLANGGATVSGLPFAGKSWICLTGDQTATANGSKMVETTATSATVTGAGSDVIAYQCSGN